MVLLFAVLVVTPLALLLVNIPHASATHTLLFRVINIFQPLAAALALVSFLLPKGVIASALATGWLLFAGLVATLGLGRLSSSRFTHVEELSINAGLIYLPVGAIWMVFSRLGAMPFGFQEPIVTLTAVHFHYAGFATPIIVGMIGRKLVEVKSSAPTTYRLAAFGVIIGSPLLALGITLSPLIEVIAAILLATCLTILALLTLFAIVPKIEKRSTHVDCWLYRRFRL